MKGHAKAKTILDLLDQRGIDHKDLLKIVPPEHWTKDQLEIQRIVEIIALVILAFQTKISDQQPTKGSQSLNFERQQDRPQGANLSPVIRERGGKKALGLSDLKTLVQSSVKDLPREPHLNLAREPQRVLRLGSMKEVN
jgi:hypothetical protein